MSNHARLSAVILAALSAAGCADEVRCESTTYTCEEAYDWANLSPRDGIDFVTARAISDHDGDGVPYVYDAQSWGEACASAADRAGCMEELDSLQPELGEGDTYVRLLAYTDASGAHVALDDDAFLALLGPIDSVGDMVWAAQVNAGERPDCSSEPIEVDRTCTWRMEYYAGSEGECPIIDSYGWMIVRANALVELEAAHREGSTGVCEGRRPDGWTPSDSCGHGVGQDLATIATFEAAAIVAFADLARDLARLSAPAELVERCREAMRDEVMHAQVMGDLARSAGVTPQPVGLVARKPLHLYDLAMLNAIEGCARETFGVAAAAFRSRRAQTPELRAAFARVAADELRHAALSWDIAAWAERQLSPAQRADVAEARESAFDALFETFAQGTSLQHPSLGFPSATEACTIVRVLQRELRQAA